MESGPLAGFFLASSIHSFRLIQRLAHGPLTPSACRPLFCSPIAFVVLQSHRPRYIPTHSCGKRTRRVCSRVYTFLRQGPAPAIPTAPLTPSLSPRCLSNRIPPASGFVPRSLRAVYPAVPASVRDHTLPAIKLFPSCSSSTPRHAPHSPVPQQPKFLLTLPRSGPLLSSVAAAFGPSVSPR